MLRLDEMLAHLGGKPRHVCDWFFAAGHVHPVLFETAFQRGASMPRTISRFKSGPKLPSFEPVLADSVPCSDCFRIGRSPPLVDIRQKNVKRWLDRLVTRAVFGAALVATDSRSAYELEQKFGPNTLAGAASKTEWAEQRDHLWDKWERGNSVIPRMCQMATNLAESRLAAIRSVSELADEVLSLAMWRYLDPSPLTVTELAPSRNPLEQEIQRWRSSQNGFALGARREAVWLLEMLTNYGSRYDAMSALWHGLRSATVLDDMGFYVLLMLCWLSARPVIKSDLVFGRIADELYDLTLLHYSWLKLEPYRKDSYDQAIISLLWIRIPVVSDPNSFGAQILESTLTDLLESRPEVMQAAHAEWKRRLSGA